MPFTMINNIIDSHFSKTNQYGRNHTLAHYPDGSSIAGGQPSENTFYTHICYSTIKLALETLANQNKPEYTVVETGCSAHGTKSTSIWDKFVNAFGGKVTSVDLSKSYVNLANQQTSCKTHVEHSDSLIFLAKLKDKIDFLYLDSYDVDFLNPYVSALHHLKEFNCVKNLLKDDAVILIDDTPKSPEWLDGGSKNGLYREVKDVFNENMSGKGSLVNHFLSQIGANKILHQYQTLWQLNGLPKNLYDIVICVGSKDLDLIKSQIEFTKRNVIGYRNIYLITNDTSLNIEGCTTIDENIFPFGVDTIEKHHGNNLIRGEPRHGWYLQQLLKIYAGRVIPNILDKYLVIDADTFFLKPTIFTENNKCLYNWGTENHGAYFKHMAKLDPEFHRVKSDKSGICHHMIFEIKYWNEIIHKIESNHGEKFYDVFLKNVSHLHSGASEYEIYFNYMLKFHSDKIKLRKLNWGNSNIEKGLSMDLDYASDHWYKRKK